ncbi:hypothetical protein SteCoe_12056 [Stentor coeruleus]|uniref:Uncharacterized protein n=1 Tax=Stentor coeruleus TaxID=5963 RepID=A0A1R2CBP4_9CILI|nr:hypothetical protein SteCoe_12056 [Stentor coeruleus]
MRSNLKSKQIQRKLERLEKSHTEIELLNQKRKKIHQNQSICQVFTKERRQLIEYNSKLQMDINSYIQELQIIRRNNENLHQEAQKLANHTNEMCSQSNLYKKEQQELQRDIEKLQKDIVLISKTRISKENEYFKECEKLEKTEEKVNEMNKDLKNLENIKNQEVENLRKILKDIKRVQGEINKIRNARKV